MPGVCALFLKELCKAPLSPELAKWSLQGGFKSQVVNPEQGCWGEGKRIEGGRAAESREGKRAGGRGRKGRSEERLKGGWKRNREKKELGGGEKRGGLKCTAATRPAVAECGHSQPGNLVFGEYSRLCQVAPMGGLLRNGTGSLQSCLWEVSAPAGHS